MFIQYAVFACGNLCRETMHSTESGTRMKSNPVVRCSAPLAARSPRHPCKCTYARMHARARQTAADSCAVASSLWPEPRALQESHRSLSPCTACVTPCDPFVCSFWICAVSWQCPCTFPCCARQLTTATPQVTPTFRTCTLRCRSVQRSPTFGSSSPPLAETRSLTWRSQGLNG